MLRIRDPIHGSIRVSPEELAVVDHRGFQRLRAIKQLGFAEMAFPGATHNRYAHGLGAMHVAGLVFDHLFPVEKGRLPPEDRARLRQALRFALLLHDVGHAPASHASEQAMPPVSGLGLVQAGAERAPGGEATGGEGAADRRATHEDYTLKLVVDSALTPVIDAAGAPVGLDARAVAHLISGRFPERRPVFVVGGVDYTPLLSQVVSGELDADRMDYLQRDSHYAGVNYGRFDQQWLLENLAVQVEHDRAYLALSHRAIFAFEDFLLSRFHMFVSVYHHYIPVGFDAMLARFLSEAPEDFTLPVDAEAYLACDDVSLWSALRASSNRWARRITARAGFRRVFESNAVAGLDEVDRVAAALVEAGIEHFVSRDQGVLSKYYGPRAAHAELGDRPIFVVHESTGRVSRIEDYSRIFERYAQPAPLVRIYCPPELGEAARRVVQGEVGVENREPVRPGALSR